MDIFSIDPFVTVRIDGKAVKLAKLSIRDRARLVTEIKAQKVAELKATLKDAGITGKEFVNEVEALQRAPLTEPQWQQYMQSEAGIQGILEACAVKSPDLGDSTARQAFLDNLSSAVAWQLAVILCGYAVRPVADDESEPAEVPADRPSEPAVLSPSTT